ncbi:hypothetical protein IPJ72_06015 [Candidatus Peregrinibacteria bacterium]|nr:MAG: hypothetical protein IPJ72_06015 [Candidatus Peregrinibacteria bacterium]
MRGTEFSIDAQSNLLVGSGEVWLVNGQSDATVSPTQITAASQPGAIAAASPANYLPAPNPSPTSFYQRFVTVPFSNLSTPHVLRINQGNILVRNVNYPLDRVGGQLPGLTPAQDPYFAKNNALIAHPRRYRATHLSLYDGTPGANAPLPPDSVSIQNAAAGTPHLLPYTGAYQRPTLRFEERDVNGVLISASLPFLVPTVLSNATQLNQFELYEPLRREIPVLDILYTDPYPIAGTTGNFSGQFSVHTKNISRPPVYLNAQLAFNGTVNPICNISGLGPITPVSSGLISFPVVNAVDGDQCDLTLTVTFPDGYTISKNFVVTFSVSNQGTYLNAVGPIANAGVSDSITPNQVQLTWGTRNLSSNYSLRLTYTDPNGIPTQFTNFPLPAQPRTARTWTQNIPYQPGTTGHQWQVEVLDGGGAVLELMGPIPFSMVAPGTNQFTVTHTPSNPPIISNVGTNGGAFSAQQPVEQLLLNVPSVNPNYVYEWVVTDPNATLSQKYGASSQLSVNVPGSLPYTVGIQLLVLDNSSNVGAASFPTLPVVARRNKNIDVLSAPIQITGITFMPGSGGNTPLNAAGPIPFNATTGLNLAAYRIGLIPANNPSQPIPIDLAQCTANNTCSVQWAGAGTFNAPLVPTLYQLTNPGSDTIRLSLSSLTSNIYRLASAQTAQLDVIAVAPLEIACYGGNLSTPWPPVNTANFYDAAANGCWVLGQPSQNCNNACNGIGTCNNSTNWNDSSFNACTTLASRQVPAINVSLTTTLTPGTPNNLFAPFLNGIQCNARSSDPLNCAAVPAAGRTRVCLCE